ncbi:MAG: hypothetical protein Q9174_005776, partial [Haloplaca sp. 1 TL-2023]
MGKQYISKIKAEIAATTPKTEKSKPAEQVSVFHHLLTSQIPETEKSDDRLLAESMVLIIAGTFTSAHTLSMIVYHALSEPRIGERLRRDLEGVMGGYPQGNPRWADLEKVEYLQACVKEAL